MIRCIVFDFDGTLVDSDQIKHDGFFAVTRELDPDSEIMRGVLARKPGDRWRVFESFIAIAQQSGSVGAVLAELVAAYTQYCREMIAKAAEITGAEAALKKLTEDGYALYVNSATPDVPLTELVGLRRIDAYFSGVYGSGRSKHDNLVVIAKSEKLTPDQIVMVGNGPDDKEAASLFGCRFIAVGNHEGAISDLSVLPNLLHPQKADV